MVMVWSCWMWGTSNSCFSEELLLLLPVSADLPLNPLLPTVSALQGREGGGGTNTWEHSMASVVSVSPSRDTPPPAAKTY